MAKLVFGLGQSLDGYVNHDKFDPDPVLFGHFTDHVANLAGCLYGRRLYELMSYWDQDDPDWDEARRAYAVAWRSRPKWVVSTTLTSVGPNAQLVTGDLAAFVRNLKARNEGEIDVAGPRLAASLSGLIDEYRMYLHPVVLGGGDPYFAGPSPPLRLVATDPIGEVLRLTYAPA